MNKKKRTGIVLIVVASLIFSGTIAYLVYRRQKRKTGESVSESIGSVISSTVNAGYTKESFPLKMGMKGEEVEKMQLALIRNGVSVGATGADGKFGKNTLAGVRAYYNNATKSQVSSDEFILMVYGELKNPL
jgi:peptidoglycan hydrolase-like protein with peptidoglycan-binding domain